MSRLTAIQKAEIIKRKEQENVDKNTEQTKDSEH